MRKLEAAAVILGVSLFGWWVQPSAALAQPASDEDMENARVLYGEAEEHFKLEEWAEAAEKYEEAYYLVPSKHGFAYKVGKSAWEAGDCARADKYLSHYRTYADIEKHPEYATEADRILNQIEFKGCAAEPNPEETEASKKGCSVGGEASPLGLAVLMLVAARRRRT